MPVRKLTKTQQTWQDEGNCQIFNTPVETGKTLDANQGKVTVCLPGPSGGFLLDFYGTCGIVSCVNILRLAGRIESSEKEFLSYALQNHLCEVDLTDPGACGGTDPLDRQSILQYFGLKSEFWVPSVEALAYAVSQGHGVIIGVDASLLWEAEDIPEGSGHAIIVTSVKIDSDGYILGFYVCDSGSGQDDSARYYDVETIENSMLPGYPMNVTCDIIR